MASPLLSVAETSPLSTLYIANFTFGIVLCVSASFFISLNDGLSSIVSFIVFPSADDVGSSDDSLCFIA